MYQKVNEITVEISNFLDQWEDDILSIFTDFEREELVFCDLYVYKDESGGIGGLFFFQEKEDLILIELDYLTPEHRNKGIGAAFLSPLFDQFKKRGFKKVIALTGEQIQLDYLSQLGFKESRTHAGKFERVFTQ